MISPGSARLAVPIDPLSHDTLSLSQAARRLPRLRAGRPVHPSTLWRWALTGLRGVRLETTMVGGVRVTSAAALRRFFAAVAAQSIGEAAADQPAEVSGRVTATRHDENIERQLDAEGL
jgi:hypothetical protein